MFVFSQLLVIVLNIKRHKILAYFFLNNNSKQTCKAFKALQVSFIFFIAFLFTTSLFAQRPPAGVGGNSGSYPNPSDTDSIPQDTELEADTANISYFFPNNPGRFYTDKDSLLGDYFQQYDPSRHRGLDYFNLGRVNSAAYSSVYQPVFRRGLDIGMHAYDVYQIKNDDVRFYQQGKAVSDLFYSGSQQQNGLIKARFSRNFADGINFSVDYMRSFNINELNSQGPFFQRKLTDGTTQNLLYEGFPRGRVTALGTGFWIHKEKYDGYLTYTVNLVQQLDNGGIANDSLFRVKSLLNALPVILTKALTNYKKQEIAYLQYYKLNKKDSTGTKRSYLASHRIGYKSAEYLSYDPYSNAPTLEDSTFYGSLLNDKRGLRFYLKENQIENAFNISTTKPRSSKDTSTKVTGLKDWFEVGIAHSFHSINQETFKRNINNVIVNGRWNFTPNENVKVETYAHFNILGYNIGDYRLNGEMYFNVKNIGSLNLKAVNTLYEPSYIQNQAYLTQREIWKNNFKKTLETSLSGTLTIPKLNFEGTVAYSLLNNYVYFDKTLKPQQATAPLSIVQLILSENLKFGSFHLENTIAIQKPTEKFLRLPDLYSKNSLYTEGKVFKKAMLARVGVDVRYATAWFAPAYMPLTGQFYVQETEKVSAYTSVDAFLSFKVKTFRFFIKAENLIGSFSKSVYYQTYNYPVLDRQFRFGIRWNLLN